MSTLAERLLTRSGRVAAAIVLLLGAPILVAGELSDADARQRASQDDLNATAQVARRAADLMSARLRLIAEATRDAAAAGVLGAAVVDGQPDRLVPVLRAFAAVMPPDVRRVFVLDAPTGALLAEEPSADDSAPRSYAGSDFYEVHVRRDIGFLAVPYYISEAYASTARGSGPLVAVSALGLGGNGPSLWQAILVAEVDLSAIREWLAPTANEAEDIYVVDGTGRLLGRAAATPGVVSGDLRQLSSAQILDALSGRHVSRITEDPIAGSERLVATAALGITPPGLAGGGADAHWNWQVIAVRSEGGLVGDVEAGLVQTRLLRIALVLVMAVAALLLSRAFATVVEQRRVLAVTNEQLARATAAKSDFLSSMSHELRTPLNAIIGFAEVLLERFFGDLNPKQEEYLRDILASGQHQLALVNDILDLSKVEAGQMELDAGPVSLGSVVDSCVLLVRERAARHSIALSEHVDPAIGTITADERKLKQVVLNLLSNAVKYTPDGGRVAVAAERDDGHVVISVRDTGPGIAPEDQQRIFEEFRQTAVGRATEGSTGLGLSLAKRLVELHGGAIGVESQLGVGSMFWVRLPTEIAPPSSAWIVDESRVPKGEQDAGSGSLDSRP